MIEEIKSMFTEKTIPTVLVMVIGVVLGVILGVFTPVKNFFNGRRR